MALKPKFTVKVDEPKWLKLIRDKQRPVATAAVQALRDVAAVAVQEGRQDIAAAGSGFTHAKWLSGLQYKSVDYQTQGGEPSLEARAIIFHTYGIAGVFESGATIHGKPLLWLPTDAGLARLGGVRRPSRSRKKLTFATVKGVPMAFDVADKARDRKPLYIGVPQVTIPKKFHIVDIVRKNAAKLGAAFVKEFKDN
jgi:hypothetical protein